MSKFLMSLFVILVLSMGKFCLAGPFYGSHMEGPEDLGKAKVSGGEFVSAYQGKGFTGGGENENIVVKLDKRFPAEAGTMSMFFRLNESAELDKSITLFDVLGTPNWWDRILLSIMPKANNELKVYMSVCESNRGRYAGREVTRTVTLSEKEWHHVACSWENINSGKADAVFKIYLDGVLVRQKDSLDLMMKNPGDKMIFAGVNPPMKPGPGGCVTIDEVSVWEGALPPSAIAGMAAGKDAMANDYADLSICPVYKLKGKAPVIDGDFSEEEWSETQTLGPFRNFSDAGILSTQQTRVNVAYADGKLFIGWKAFGTSNPKGQEHKEEANLWKEDSLELLFSPDSKKVLHFIGNAYSSIFDEISEDGDKTWSKDWRGAWDYKSSVNDGYWAGELALDMKAFGLPEIKPGTEMIFNACRNIFTPREANSVWNKCKGSFKNPKLMGRLRFYDKGVIVNNIVMDETVAGVSRMSLFMKNPYNLKGSRLLALAATPVDESKKTLDESSVLLDSAQAEGETVFEYSVKNAGEHSALLSLSDSKSGKDIYVRPLYLDVNPPLHVTVSGNACEGFFTASINGRYLRGAIASGKLELLGSKGEAVFSQATSSKRIQKIRIPTADVEPGDYIVKTEFLSADGQQIAERNIDFTLPPRPEYISSDAGTKNYTKPWGPVTLEGQTVKCWNREYVFDNSLFPKKLVSNGADLLSGQPAFTYSTGTSQMRQLKDAQLKVRESDDEKVVFDFRASDNVLSAAGTITVEYDGLIIYDMAVNARGSLRMNKLNLEVPMAAEYAKFIIEGNEYTFREEKNVISKPGFSKGFEFKPMLGVGCAERALFWFCESDEGWKPYDREDTITVTRTENDVKLSFNIMRGSSFKKPLRMKCGFMCSPVRPAKHVLDRERWIHYWPGGPFLATDKNDYSVYKLDEAAKRGARVVGMHEWWPRHYGGSVPTNPQSMKDFVKHAHKVGMKVILYRSAMTNEQEPSQLYFGDTWLRNPVSGFNKYAGYARPGAATAVTRCPNSKEYIDWYVGNCRHLVREYGVDGFYYDFCCGGCTNPLHGCGYEQDEGGGSKRKKGQVTKTIGINYLSDGSDYGNRRETYPVLRHRELWRRMYNMVKEEIGDEGMINSHIAYTGDAVYFAFVDTMLHSETSACYSKQGEYPAPQFYRMFYSKEYLGFPGELIFHSDKRTDADNMMSVSLLHREWYRIGTVGRFARFDDKRQAPVLKVWKTLGAYGTDDAVWHPYWEHTDADMVQVSDWGLDKMLCSYWQKDSGLLLVLSNVSDTEREATVSFGAGSEKFKTVIDVYAGSKKAISDKLVYDMKPHTYKFIRVE